MLIVRISSSLPSYSSFITVYFFPFIFCRFLAIYLPIILGTSPLSGPPFSSDLDYLSPCLINPGILLASRSLLLVLGVEWEGRYCLTLV